MRNGLGLYNEQLVIARGYWPRNLSGLGQIVAWPAGASRGTVIRASDKIALMPRPGTYGDTLDYTTSISGMGGLLDYMSEGIKKLAMTAVSPATAVASAVLPSVVKEVWGKSQDWYNNMTKVENDLVLTNNAVFALGKTAWNTVYQQVKAAGSAMDFVMFDDVQGQLVESIKQFTAPANGDKENITDTQIATASARVSRFKPMIEFVKKAFADDKPLISALNEEQNRLNSALNSSPPYRSPQAAARAEFVKSVAERAGAVFDFAKYALPIGLAAGVALFFATRKK